MSWKTWLQQDTEIRFWKHVKHVWRRKKRHQNMTSSRYCNFEEDWNSDNYQNDSLSKVKEVEEPSIQKLQRSKAQSQSSESKYIWQETIRSISVMSTSPGEKVSANVKRCTSLVKSVTKIVSLCGVKHMKRHCEKCPMILCKMHSVNSSSPLSKLQQKLRKKVRVRVELNWMTDI